MENNLLQFIHPDQKNKGLLVLEDGTVFLGRGIGKPGIISGELCFNTSMTGYQEIMTDPSYAGQMIVFTFPHIGNTGANDQDHESRKVWARGVILRNEPTLDSNHRSNSSFKEWLKKNHITSLYGIDTRQLVSHIRDKGYMRAALCYSEGELPDIESLKRKALDERGLEGLDIASQVTSKSPYRWEEIGENDILPEYSQRKKKRLAVIDYGVKKNLLSSLAQRGCEIHVFPAQSSFKDIMDIKPDGMFLSNGPGDPEATGEYAVPMIQEAVQKGLPIMGVCMGHQILAQALGAKTKKMKVGHRGGNHPVKDLNINKVEITSQNHGFVVDENTIPKHIKTSHISLFDGSVEGIEATSQPIFSIQFHPEASPGPHDTHYLFSKFVDRL